jgi:hypothetical protein
MRSEVFDTGSKTIVDCPHVRVERLDTDPVLFSKVFKEYEDRAGQKYDYRYWAERENFFLREFLKKKNEFTCVVQPRHLISENEAAKQVLTCDAGITVANWLRVKPRYADGAELSHPFQRADAFLRLLRACLVALRQIHAHRIVHCDIKEDNICLPYAPHPYRGEGQKTSVDFSGLKLIDFAFSISHAMPLTQILVINPDDKAPYQSQRLIAALQADRLSGSPNAVQHLDYRVDLFSLGYMAGKITAGGLECPPGPDGPYIVEGARDLVAELKAFDTAADDLPLPHDGLLARIDSLLQLNAGRAAQLEFNVAGEWVADDMRRARTGVHQTPLTPVAPPVPTPVALPPLNPALNPALNSTPDAAGVTQKPGWKATLVPSRLVLGMTLGALLSVALVYAEGGDFMRHVWAGLPLPSRSAPAAASPAPKPDAYAASANRLAAQLRSGDDQLFKNAVAEATKFIAGGKAAAVNLAASIVNENGQVLESGAAQAARAHALARLKLMAAAGNTAALQRIAAFEKSYDETKQKIAASAWWAAGEGAPPEEAVRWIESGAILADGGDRPAMLDQAFAEGHGRVLKQDRAAAVQMYLKVLARAQGGDEVSARIRLAAGHGLAATLNAVIEQKDAPAASTLQPQLEAKADAGAADMQYYVGLIDECVDQPANLSAARRRYLQAAADPGWKNIAEKKLGLIGRWCPRQAG